MTIIKYGDLLAAEEGSYLLLVKNTVNGHFKFFHFYSVNQSNQSTSTSSTHNCILRKLHNRDLLNIAIRLLQNAENFKQDARE